MEAELTNLVGSGEPSRDAYARLLQDWRGRRAMAHKALAQQKGEPGQDTESAGRKLRQHRNRQERLQLGGHQGEDLSASRSGLQGKFLNRVPHGNWLNSIVEVCQLLNLTLTLAVIS